MTMTCTCCQPLSETQRIDYPAALFGGAGFAFQVEPTIFNIAGALSPGYAGGLWEFYALSNGGFYMAPKTDEPFEVACQNGFEGRLSTCAFGMTACLYAFSQLSFGDGPVAEACAEQYHRLREHAVEHREAQDILAAID
jgi:hypothetical protein